MKIILLEDIKKKGKKGDILTVKDGYGNFLIKDNKAILASDNNMNKLEKENIKKQKELDEQVKYYNKIKEKLEKEKIVFNVRTGSGDKVFGSISSKQIASKLNDLGYDIDKKNIKTNTSLTSLGVHEVAINLHKMVSATIKIQLKK